MAHLYETRDYPVDLTGVTDLTRVVCIGDSMMYGQGVLPRHTLPAHLNATLNAAYPHHLIWVDNQGQSSGNIWNAWSAFRGQARTTKYDALVFSICQNDSQVFDSNTVRYSPSEKLQYWLPGTSFRTLVEQTLAEIRDFCDAEGIKPVILYYSFVAADEPIVKILQEICDGLNIPLMDMLAYFQQESGVSVREYIASPFDGHPSSPGHESCSRQIARTMLQSGVLDDANEIEGRSVSEAMIETCRILAANGLEAPKINLWSEQVLKAKEQRFRRIRKLNGKAALGDVEEVRTTVREISRAWHDRMAADVGAPVLVKSFSSREAEILANRHANIRNLGEMAYCAEVATGDVLMEGLSGLLDSSEFLQGPGRLRPIAEDWANKMAERAEQIDKIAQGSAAAAKRMVGSPAARSYLLTIAELTGQATDYLRQIEQAITKRADEIERPESLTFWQVCEYTATTTVSTLLTFWDSIKAALPDAPEHDLIATRVAVILEGKAVDGLPKGACNLQVEIDSTVPQRRRHRDKLWAGVEEERFLYVFEIPLTLQGDLRVGVPDRDPLKPRFDAGATRIARIQVSQVAANVEPEEMPVLLTWEADPDQNPHVVEFPDLRLL